MNKSFVTNVLGPIHTTNAFLPLLRKGTTKKMMTLCSILGVCDVTLLTNFAGYAAYSVTKSMLDMVSAKFACEIPIILNVDWLVTNFLVALKDEGFTVLGISPGVVWTYDLQRESSCLHAWQLFKPTTTATPEIKALVEESAAPYKMLYPTWKGPFELTAAKSVEMMLQVLDNAGPEDSGKVLSHFVSTIYSGIFISFGLI
jgi:NAD(P)-dependent dehydrogenase (short-subunit alcohol dehydrogenase family)